MFQLLDLKKGFSLPLWVAGDAKSALKKLVGLPFKNYELIVSRSLITPVEVSE